MTVFCSTVFNHCIANADSSWPLPARWPTDLPIPSHFALTATIDRQEMIELSFITKESLQVTASHFYDSIVQHQWQGRHIAAENQIWTQQFQSGERHLRVVYVPLTTGTAVKMILRFAAKDLES